MHIDIVTIFPDLFEAFRSTGVLGKAVERGVVEISVHDLRDWADNKWNQLDDVPYGGGAGMVIQAPPVLSAVRELREKSNPPPRIVLLSPRGRVFNQKVAQELAEEPSLMVLCGRYEGFDERVVDILQPEELSVGDFILGGGEVAAMVVVETVTRLIEGVVGDPESVAADSFSEGLLDHPCYTRPPEVEGRAVPGVLRSGNHEAVRRWRLEQAVQATVTRRRDLVNENWENYPEEVRRMILDLEGRAGRSENDNREESE